MQYASPIRRNYRISLITIMAIPKPVTELALPPRSPKPRRRGITSMIDFGPDTFGWSGGERGIADLLDVAAN